MADTPAAVTTPRLDAYLVQLSYKLRDPVPDLTGTGDGKVFKFQSKLDYINRAYGSLRRKLGSIRSNPEEIFIDFFDVIEKSISTPAKMNDYSLPLLGLVETADNVYDIKDVYVVKYPASETEPYTQVGRADPESYVASKYGKNKAYSGSDAAKQYWWSVLNKKLVFIGDTNTKISKVIVFIKNPVKKFVRVEPAEDMLIPREYDDLLLTLAAYEAMIDKGDVQSINKATMYDRWIKSELEIELIKEKLKRDKGNDKVAN